MSTSQFLGMYELPSSQETDARTTEHMQGKRKRVFIGLRPPTIPENRFLTYATIESLLDIAHLPDRVVILVSDEDRQLEMARVIGQQHELLGIDPVHMDGIPGTETSAAFRDAVFGIPTISHSAFLQELALDLEVEEQRNASLPRRKIEKERDQISRKDGTVKEADIGVAGTDSED